MEAVPGSLETAFTFPVTRKGQTGKKGMVRILAVLTTALVAALVWGGPSGVLADGPPSGEARPIPSHMPGRVLVRFKSDQQPRVAAQAIPAIGALVLAVPLGEEESRVAAFRADPWVDFAELDGVVRALGEPNDLLYPMQRWKRINPAEAGNVDSLLLDPRDSQVLYMAALSGTTSSDRPSRGGVYKSRDGGATWSRILETSGPLAMHPLNPSVIYSAQVVWHPGPRGVPESSTTFVWKSTDGGATWQQIPAVESPGPAAIGFGLFAFDPQNPEVIYAGSGTEGVFKSEDGGLTWAFKGPGKSEVFSLAVDPGHSRIVYATLNAGVYVSHDAGATWRPTLQVPFSPSVVVGRSGSVYVPGFYSPDRGCSWLYLPTSGQRLALDPDSDRVVYSAGFGPANIAGENPGVLLSTDGGVSWRLVGERLARGDIRALAVTPTTPRNLYLATSDGLWTHAFPVPVPEKGPEQEVFKVQAGLLGFPILRPAYVPAGLSCGLSVQKCDRGFRAYWEGDGHRLGLNLACGNLGESGRREPYPFRGTSATLIKGRPDKDFVLAWREPGAEMGYTLGAKGLSWEEFLRVANSLELVGP